MADVPEPLRKFQERMKEHEERAKEAIRQMIPAAVQEEAPTPKPEPEPFYIRVVTGASSNHFKSLYQLLESLCLHHEPSELDLIVWDLGLTELERKVIETEYSLKMRTFDYSKYPEYFTIQVDAGQYAWKPVLMEETTKEGGDGVYLWLDAGDKVTKSLKTVHTFTAKHGIYSPSSSGILSEWVYAKVFDSIDPRYKNYLRLPMRTGGIQGYNTKIPWVKDFLQVLGSWAKRKEVIAPDGSNRQNHRQDQALFSLLYWDAQKMYRFDTTVNYSSTILIHQDID